MKRRALMLALAGLTIASPAWGAPRKKPKPKVPKQEEPQETPKEAPAAAAPRERPRAGAPVEVVVVDVAGDLTYVRPGASGGLLRGSKVVFRGREHKVIGATATYAVIAPGANGPRENEKGTAVAAAEGEAKTSELAPPRPLTAFAAVWPEPVAPASTQRPKYVPLGSPERAGRTTILLSSTGAAIVPLDERGAPLARGEIRARVHAEPFSAPIALDADAAMLGYAASDLSQRQGSRPLLRVRELLLGLGRSSSFYAGVGRMRYAASTLGTLDGVRAQAPLGAGLSLGAFGGALPNPLDEGISLDAQRFGVEARYADLEAGLRPEVAVVGHASTFKGGIDERRLSGVVGLFPGRSRIGGHFEVSAFDRDNPFGAAPIEVTAAGADASFRTGSFQLGARFDLRQAERSRYLASFLPLSWFCPTTAGPTGDTCRGAGERMLQGVDASLELGNVGLTAAGTAQQTLGGGPSMLGGFAGARVVRILRHLRVEASAQASSGTYLDVYGGSAGPGLTLLGGAFDAAVYYREARLRYRAFDQSLAQHAVGAMFVVLPGADVLVSLQGEGQTGDDVSAIVALLHAMWRPRL